MVVFSYLVFGNITPTNRNQDLFDIYIIIVSCYCLFHNLRCTRFCIHWSLSPLQYLYMDLDVINTFLEDKIEYCRLHGVTKSRSSRKYKIRDRLGKSKGAKSAIPETGTTCFTWLANISKISQAVEDGNIEIVFEWNGAQHILHSNAT